MKKQLIITLIFYLFFQNIFAQSPVKTAFAHRTSIAPKIDGFLNDSCWIKSTVINDFVQFHPVFNSKASQKTEVRIAYDDQAIYIGALLYDISPDSILTQLGNRDDDLNADGFNIQFDTYNQQSDAYIFGVTASGVQVDFKEKDYTYNAVWESSVKITDKGWQVEMKLPYSALRFPKTPVQTWGLQITRLIRRSRERIQWAPEEKGTSNRIVYWGKLYGLENINPSLRLSFTPYLSAYVDHFPYNTEGVSNFSRSISGGMDLKYGINESFTLDMTLLPDFSQVQSDNYIKNLSPFETIYDEQRPFFTEAVDLFQKGDIFYSRRIGHTPFGFYNLQYELNLGDKIIKNPSQAKLINATKISGRTKKGLALGFFNAITNNTYALIQDSVGNTFEKLTDPMSNYNIIVLDQTMKNNSNFYFINTNVIRDKGYNNSNVSASGLSLIDNSNTWKLLIAGGLSQIINKPSIPDDHLKTDLGYRYNFSFSKIKGNWQAGTWFETYDKNFNANDMGVTFYNNYHNYGLHSSYNIYEPFGKFLNMYNYFQMSRSQNFTTLKPIDSQIRFNHNATTRKYFSYWAGTAFSFENVYDYYEPRIQERYYISKPYSSSWIGGSSDYRKPIAFDIQVNYTSVPKIAYNAYEFYVRPIFRINNKLSLNHKFTYTIQYNDVGFADIDSTGSVIFGNRNRTTYENTLSGKYIFKNDLSLTLRIRHYWSKGLYEEYYTLNEQGGLENNFNYNLNKDFNFNSFTADLVFSWQFAPGSNMSLVWKNNIMSDENMIAEHFFDNFNRTLQQDQLNSISIKIIYYLDYNYLKSNKKKTL